MSENNESVNVEAVKCSECKKAIDKESIKIFRYNLNEMIFCSHKCARTAVRRAVDIEDDDD